MLEKFGTKITSPIVLLMLMAVAGAAVLASIYNEYQARRSDLMKLLNRQAELFIHSVHSSTQNAITAANDIEKEINARIISSLKMVERLDRAMNLSKSRLEELRRLTSMEAIHLYNSRGDAILKVAENSVFYPSISADILLPRLGDSITDTLFTLVDVENPENDRIVAMVRRNRGGLVAALISREEVNTVKRALGVGFLLKRFQSVEDIEYIVIQKWHIC